MRRKGAIQARFGILYEILQFFVTLCLSVSYIFLGRFGTEYALIVGEHESKPLLAPPALRRKGRRAGFLPTH